MDRRRARSVVAVSLLVALVAGGAGWAFLSWAGSRNAVAQGSADLSGAILGGDWSANATSLVPGWVLVCVGGVALVVALVVGLTVLLAEDEALPSSGDAT